MKLILIQFYLTIIVALQQTCLAVSNGCLFLYGKLTDLAFKARLLIEDLKNGPIV